MTVIQFEKFKKLTHADVRASKDLDSVTISVYGKNVEEPITEVVVDDFKSLDFIQNTAKVYSELSEKSNMRHFATELVPGKKKGQWNVQKSEEEGMQNLHPDQYLEYGIYAHMEPILKNTNTLIMRLLAEIAVQIINMKGERKALESWFPEGVVYNGVFMRSGSRTSGKLPSSAKQIAKWNPTDMQWH